MWKLTSQSLTNCREEKQLTSNSTKGVGSRGPCPVSFNQLPKAMAMAHLRATTFGAFVQVPSKLYTQFLVCCGIGKKKVQWECSYCGPEAIGGWVKVLSAGVGHW